MQPHRAAIRHCPRCVGRNRLLVELFSSTLPADVLYDHSSLPRVDGGPASARSRSVAYPSCDPPRRAWCARPDTDESARRLATPSKHLGMEVAYALLAERERHPALPSAKGQTVISHACPRRSAHGTRGHDASLGSSSDLLPEPLTSISIERAAYAS